MVRLTPALIRKHNPTLRTMAVDLVITDERKLRFKAVANVNAPNANGDGNSVQNVEIADNNGKVRTWPNIDDALRALAKENYGVTSIAFTANTEKLVPSFPDTYTPAQIAQKQHGAIVKSLPAQNGRVTVAEAALAAIAAFATGTPAQQGQYAEKKAIRDTALAQQAWLIAERDRLATLFTPPANP